MAIAKVQNDYLKHYKVLGIKGGFAILYPEELARPMPIEVVRDFCMKARLKLVSMFPPEDARPFNVYEGLLPQVARKIAEHVLTPPKYVEPSIDYIIKSLRESAMYIVNGLRHLASSQLEGFFGGKDVFKNILQYEEGKYPAEELKFAAAYLLVNQLLFYHVISRLRSEFPEIDPDAVLHPSDSNTYFRRVLDTNYKAVFSYDVASLIPPKFLGEIRTIINVIKGLSAEKVGGDLLGTIFHDLIPFDVRKNVAAFYTNVLAAELLASLAIDRSDVKVADFAVGSGGLLVAAYRRKKELLNAPFTQEVHRRFVEEELLGVDVMPFAANIAACHLALQSPHYFTNKVQIAIWDSTDLTPEKVIPSAARLEMVLTGQTFLDSFIKPTAEAKGVVSLNGKRAEEIKLETYDLVIMNPPFTRQERLPKEYKKLCLRGLRITKTTSTVS
jgi:type I restriction-modification system DNA methylase subunit